MAIDFQTEQVISLTQAARELPSLRNNRPVAPPTIWRWTRHGVNAGGRTIKLETTSIAGRTCTSREAVQRFLNACAAARSGQAVPEQITPSAARIREQAEAARVLEKDGI